MARDRSSEIHWEEWGDHAFDRARDEDKLVLLNIGAPWCHWCHVLDRSSYSDPEVIEVINARYVPVRVEADRRPDIQDRYLMGGWPTIAVLTPDGRILTGSTYMPPERMLRMLRQVDQLYHDDKTAVTLRVARLSEQAEDDRYRGGAPTRKLDPSTVVSIVNAMRRDFDSINGGFGTEPKFPFPDAVRLSFLQYRRTGDEFMLEMALGTLDGMASLIDPVWGGMYRYSVDAQWKHPHYEKMLAVQAGALDNYLEAYQVTADDRYGARAADIDRYIRQFLSDRELGGFYGSQDADVGSHEPEADLVTGERYFPKSEDERLQIGMPYTDKTVYTAWNGMMCSAYLRLCAAMDDMDAGNFAFKTIDRLLAENLRDGLVYHYNDGEPRLPGLLADQSLLAQALLDACQTSGRRSYLEHAEQIARVMLDEIQDKEQGGFYYQRPDPEAIGELSQRNKPFEENVAAAKTLVQLHYMTGKEPYREAAGRALEAVSYSQMLESIMGACYGLALDLYLEPPVHIVVVGDRAHTETAKMLKAGLHAYEPRKLVQVLDPGEDELTIGDLMYAAHGEPAAYVCVRNVCMNPVTGSEALTTTLEDVLGGTPS